MVVLLCGGYAVGAALGWGTPAVALFMGDFGLAAAALAACLSCLWHARTVSGRARPAWVLFAGSSAMVAAGNGVWGWYEVVLRQPVPRLSAADFCFLLFAPLAIVGLLVLANRPVNKAGWICLGLDAWLIGGSLVTLTWSLALARTAEWDGRSTPRVALSLAYPVFDILLVSMVLALHFRRFRGSRPAVNTAIGALAVTVLCDALFTSPMLREHYHSGQILDAGWFAGSMLQAYAPWVGGRSGARGGTRGDHPRRRSAGTFAALTPYLAAGVCTLAILIDLLDGRKIDRVMLFTGCTVALVLVVRQGIMLLDNIALTRELAEAENHFRSLVQGSSDVIMIAAPSGVLRYVSPAAKGVYARDAEEMIGTELASHIHPDDLGRVLHEVRRFLAAPPEQEPATRIECRIRSGDGGWLNVESSVNRYQGGLIFNSRDVTERVRLQAQLQHNASHDPLTDLPNRALFTERVGQALSGRRADDGQAAVLYIDLDGFKAVNDTVGHQAGDELLIQAARRLSESVRAGDTAARLGGDEFAALICGGADELGVREQQILEIAERLRITLSEPYTVTCGTTGHGRSSGSHGQPGTTQVRVAASIGVAFAAPGVTPAELMRNADLAMYRAKSNGKNRVELYAPAMQADVTRRAELAGRLGSALRNNEFTLLHQPVVDLETGRVAAVEALARWRSAQGILFTPDEFVRLTDPRADRGTEHAEVTRWTLEAAVELAAGRHRAGHHVPVAVRVPVGRLLGRDLPPAVVESLLERYHLPPDALLVEITEHDPRVCLDELERRLVALRTAGVRIALDASGAGFSGMAALRRLPVDVLRLDRSFTEGLVESARLYKITAGLLRIARELGVRTVADGVDRPEQVVALREMGCTHGQGLAFAGPLDEPRLHGALARGAFPVPRRPEPAVATATGVPLTVGLSGPGRQRQR
ncbi:putative integral membrane phosphodiesterase [Streptantibioticus cattleyicolor NRRL 8057 = DSM 46488]|uniref:Putative integral membrane phosphodiesterase n=1 Tax=Streptantibioticus cattleyicolor (strain ATCC 35852 / DSM 46488 / JCM 4925 / NBRC 14057 / NRRL 8057) TaxID=1003195 RepID=G8WSY7_STREN|nr:putative integral membrane phosphodiesterase [Streptantibioticus cattleyicolor NRRL 8057 = DSM 46488]